MARVLVLVLLLAALAAPATAGAQGSPFQPIPPVVTQSTPVPTASGSNADQQDVSRGLLLGIAGAVAVIFIFIGWYITRDARAHLTDDDRRALEGARTDNDRKRGEEIRRKARAKGKRQRQARKAQRRR